MPRWPVHPRQSQRLCCIFPIPWRYSVIHHRFFIRMPRITSTREIRSTRFQRIQLQSKWRPQLIYWFALRNWCMKKLPGLKFDEPKREDGCLSCPGAPLVPQLPPQEDPRNTDLLWTCCHQKNHRNLVNLIAHSIEPLIWYNNIHYDWVCGFELHRFCYHGWGKNENDESRKFSNIWLLGCKGQQHDIWPSQLARVFSRTTWLSW